MIRRLKKGYWYWNGHEGLRVITEINVHGHIHYVVKAAHLELAWDSEANRVVSVIGQQGKCHPRWFSVWAKVELTADAGQQLLWEIRAKRTPVSRTGSRLLREVIRHAGQSVKPYPIVRIRPEQWPGIHQLIADGFLIERGQGLLVTELGAGWLRWDANRCLTPHHLQIAPHCVTDSLPAVFPV